MARCFFIFIFGFLTCIFGAKASIDLTEEREQRNQPASSAVRGAVDQVKSGTGANNQKINFAENNPIAGLLCKAIRAFTGTIAKTLALLMIFGLGIALYSSKISPIVLVMLIIGIGMLFSAEYLVGTLIGEAGTGGGEKGASCDCKYGVSCDD